MMLAVTCLFLGCGDKITVDHSDPLKNITQTPEDWSIRELTSTRYKSVTAKHPCPQVSVDIEYVDPLPFIRKMAKDHDLVLINESHSKPLHRVFVKEVAAILAKDGFTHYGGEVLSSKFKDPNLSQTMTSRGYLLESEMTYVDTEPVLGQAIESIIASGYEFFAYETDLPLPDNAQSRIAHREASNARHILDYIALHPSEKFLIHTGPHHIMELPNHSGTKWMASYLKELSDIDPLSIGQTECFGDGVFEAGILGYALPVSKSTGKAVTYKGFDITVIPPKEIAYKDRPLWLRDNLGRKFVGVPKQVQFDDQFTRIYAFNTDRSPGSAAEDYLYREPRTDRPLALRPGAYVIQAYNKAGEILAETNVKVE